MYDTIIKVSAFLGAIIGIVAFFMKCYKVIKNIDDKINNFQDNLNENTLSTLRLVIINETMPLSERVSAGDKYVKMGGNGAVHAMYDVLKERYENELKGSER